MNKSYNTNTCKEEGKVLQGLNLINSFLFSASTKKPEDAEFIAKLIVERATGRKLGSVSVVTEKILSGIEVGSRGIRMDLYIEEYENERRARVYDIEPNNYKMTELPLQCRYSQGMTDVKLLEAGASYKALPNYISIWILPYDPFGKNRMLYTVKNCVVEDTQIVYNDGAMKLFLYMGGEVGGNENLRNLLHYLGKSDESNAVDPELSQLHSIVEHARGNRKVGEQYMTFQEYIEFEIEEGIEEGIQERIQQGIQQERQQGIYTMIESLREFQISDEQVMDKLMQKYELTEEEAKAYLD